MPEKAALKTCPKRRSYGLAVTDSLLDCTSLELVVLVQAVVDDLPTLLHLGMFVPNIKSLCYDEQTKNWLRL